MACLRGERTRHHQDLTRIDRLSARYTARPGRYAVNLHDAAPALPWPGFAAVKNEEFGRLRVTAGRLLSTHDLDRAGAEIAALAGLPAPARVPCHHDYTPRNWLVGSGVVRIVDFEWSGPDAWVADLARRQAAVALSTVETYAQTTGDSSYDAAIASAFALHPGSDFENGPDDGTAWWALVWLQANDSTHQSSYPSMAQAEWSWFDHSA